LAKQLTYVKKLGDTESLNTEAIENLSSIVKDSVIQSHGKYQQITQDLIWFNLTFFGQGTTFAVFRQLEFALLQLSQQLDENFSVIQTAILGQDTH
jgi:superoxide dismutase